MATSSRWINTLRPRQNDRHFFRRHFQIHFLEWKCLKLDLNLTEIYNGLPPTKPIVISLLTHICVTRPQSVKRWFCLSAAIAPSRCRRVVPRNGESSFRQESQHPVRTGCDPSDHRTPRGPLQHRSQCHVGPCGGFRRRWLLVWGICKSWFSL